MMQPMFVLGGRELADAYAKLAEEIAIAQAKVALAPASRECEMYLNGLLIAQAIFKNEID